MATNATRLLTAVRFYVAMAAFFWVLTVVYAVWSDFEPSGTILLALAGGLAAITGGYLALQVRLERAEVADEPPAPEEEREYHGSIWPFELACGATLALTGVVLGRFVVAAGLVVFVHAVVGWIRQRPA
jgi:hypothetical protein